jgi:hemoglobin/transferrin/lactoferrin receptor protein
MMIRLFASILVSASLLSAAAENLTETSSDTIKNLQIDEITVLSSFNSIYQGLNLPVVTLKSSDMDARQFNSPADALQNLTGIALSRDGVWATSVSIRGLSEQRLLFLSDGDRIQTATDIAAALSTFDTESLERIEVIKGAGSVLYGTGAMGGVVNLISPTPNYTDDRFELHGNAGTAFSGVNNLWGSRAELTFGAKQWYVALNGSYRTADNVKTPEGKLPNSQFNDASWSAKVGIQYDPQQEIILNYQHTKAWDVGLPGGNAFPDAATVRYLDVSREQFSGEYLYKEINDYLDKLSIKLYSQSVVRSVENIPVPNGPMVILPSSDNQTTGGKISTDWNLYDKRRLILGADLWHRNAETKRFRINQTTDVVIGEQPTPDARMLNVGVFGIYKQDFSDRFGLNVGGRLDFIRTQNDSAFNPLFRYQIVDGENVYDENPVREVLFTPDTNGQFGYALHVDFNYLPARNHKLQTSISSSYRVPSIEERFKYIDQAGAVRYGNKDLKPEQGVFGNLAYTFFDQDVQIKTDIFANYLFNLIAEKNTGTQDGKSIFINENIAQALFLGAELDLNYFIGPSLILHANASYVQGKDVSENQYLPQIAPLNGNASFAYILKKILKASVGVQWAARQSQVAENESVTDGYLTVNLSLHILPIRFQNAGLQFFAGVDNLLDTKYYNHLATTRGMMRLEPGRNIYAKATLQF